MKVTIKSYNAVAAWKWDTSDEPHKVFKFAGASDDPYGDDDDDDDECGICRLAFESCCPDCKVPGDDCPLIWGECTHIFHMHCLLKWIGTESSKGQCPLDRREWVTAERKADKLPTTVDRQPVATVPPGPIDIEAGDLSMEEPRTTEGDGDAAPGQERAAVAVTSGEAAAAGGIAGVVVDPGPQAEAPMSNPQQR